LCIAKFGFGERGDNLKTPRTIALIDCQSFYASIEKAAHPAYKEMPLAVCGDPTRRSGIVLAACPIAKKCGVTTAERIGDAISKCPELIVVQPRMAEYIRVSLQITEIYRTYADLVEPFSIDEQWVDLTASLALFGDVESIAKQIQDQVMEQTGVYVRAGISENKLLAKTSCDNFAKKRPDGIFTLPKKDIGEILWPLPINKMYMVGSRMTNHFKTMGIHTIGDLAKIPLPKLKQMMRVKFGKQSDIQAELYWRIANGIDDSPVTHDTHDTQKSIGHQMTLPRDYRTLEEILVVIYELAELVCQHCRAKHYMGWVVSVGLMGADYDRPSGFFRQMKMQDPTNLAEDVYEIAKILINKHWDKLPIRKVGVTLNELVSDEEYQYVMFGDREKKMALAHTMDKIKSRYGDAAIMRAISISQAGQAKDRSNKIGGHYK
jgi:DNA polymerase-4